MTDVYLDFRVHEITKKSNELVELKLRKIIEPPKKTDPESVELITEPDPLATIVPETDEERVVVKILLAFRKYGAFPPPPAPYVRRAQFVPCYIPQETNISMTKEDYKKLGRPGIGYKIRLGIHLIWEEEENVDKSV